MTKTGCSMRREFPTKIPLSDGSCGRHPCRVCVCCKCGVGCRAHDGQRIKHGEDVFAYISRVKGSFDQTLYQKVIGAANAFRRET